ncbi:MAG: ferredoxin reductase [Thermoleophilaceae bacterium]
MADAVAEAEGARTLILEQPDWPGHLAGQHVDVRLTAEDGYQAERSYSIASPPEEPRLALTIERLEDGEVSPYLVDEVREGDTFELRGPIGGWFTWQASDGGPLLLVAGGSGIVPLMAMVRHRANARSEVPTRLLVSARSLDALLYRAELESRGAAGDGLEVITTLTREAPDGWAGHTGRVNSELLREVGFAPDELPRVYVCGPTPFVESVAENLVGLGHDPAMVKTERFGPTGGTT